MKVFILVKLRINLGVYDSYPKAFEAWNDERKKMIAHEEEWLNKIKDSMLNINSANMYISFLKNADPNKCSQDSPSIPYIQEHEVQ